MIVALQELKALEEYFFERLLSNELLTIDL